MSKKTGKSLQKIFAIVIFLFTLAILLDWILVSVFGAHAFFYCLAVIWLAKSGIGMSLAVIFFMLGIIGFAFGSKESGIMLMIAAFLLPMIPDILGAYAGIWCEMPPTPEPSTLPATTP